MSTPRPDTPADAVTMDDIDCHNREELATVNYAGWDEIAERFKSLGTDHRVEWAVVTDDPAHGHGVFSWHYYKHHAVYNAIKTGGTALPVDRYNGKLLVPHLADQIIKRFVERGE